MNERTKTGLQILQAAVLLGILGNVLLRETPWGLNVFLFVAVFSAAMVMLVLRRKPELWTLPNAALYGAMLFFAAMFAVRDSIELKIADAIAIITAMSVLMLPRLKIQTQFAGVFHYIVGFLWSSACAAFAAPFLLSSDIKWNAIPQTGWSKHLMAVVRGLLIGLPIVLVFGALFVAADAVYQGMVERVFNVPAETIFTHILLTAIFTWLSAGYLRGVLFDGIPPVQAEPAVSSASPEQDLSAVDRMRAEVVVNPDALPGNLTILEHINKEDPPKADEKPSATEKKKWQWQNLDNSLIPPFFTLGVIETSIILGLINLLFLSFVIVQVPYLFGGMELVQSTPDFKLAEYARRGFGELVAVAALVLPILLISHWLLRKDSSTNEKIYRVLAGIQIVLLFVIMASAVQRLVLLTGNLGYGLTTVRLYPMIFMIWLGIVFVWFSLTVLRGSRQYFAWGALWSAFFVLGAAHVLNPDEFIVRTNVRLMQEGRMFDPVYNSRLSDDAVPVLLESLPSMGFEQQCVVKSKLSKRRIFAAAEDDFRSWNWSRRNTRSQMEAAGETLSTAGCPNHMGWSHSYGE